MLANNASQAAEDPTELKYWYRGDGKWYFWRSAAADIVTEQGEESSDDE